MSSKKIHVHDSNQDYTYELTEPTGKNFAPDFAPELTPEQMLKLGVFGGNYFQGEQDEFPKSWFKNTKLTDHHDPNSNFFETDASQSLQVWQQKGWLYKDDPRGWFQWYCRYYLGRRIPAEDARQIKRWRLMVRHVKQVQNMCQPGDWACRTRQRQALLHWAYDSRKL